MSATAAPAPKPPHPMGVLRMLKGAARRFAAPPPFSATGVAPAKVPTTAGMTTFTITGTGFDANTQVDVSGNGYGKVPITLVSPTTITFAQDVAQSYGEGPVHIDVRQGDAGTPQRVTFDIVNPPTITNITPLAVPKGATTQVTITGTGFTAASRVAFNGDPQMLLTGIFVSATTLVVPLVGGDYSPGPKTVSVVEGGVRSAEFATPLVFG